MDYRRLYELLVADLKHFAVFVTAKDGRIVTWNFGVRHTLGYSREEFIGQPVEIIFTPEDLAANAAEAERRIAAEQGHAPDERWHVRSDGTRLYVEGVLTALRDETGQLLGFSKIMRDATQRKQDEEERDSILKALARSNEDLRQFAYGLSHDLQAPLRHMTSYMQLLMRRHQDHMDADELEMAGFALDGVQQMQHFIRALLDYSQIVGLESRPKVEVDLDATLEGCLLMLRLGIEEAGAVITHDPLPAVMGEPIHFLQLFQNLIENALKYRSSKRLELHVSAKMHDELWVISVADNGIGVPPDQLERIFGVFRRAHGREYPGTGIGLAICKRIVESAGGRMWADSEVGQGSTFYFALPA